MNRAAKIWYFGFLAFILGVMALAILTLPASAQWQVPNGDIPYGRGRGVVGFGSVTNVGTGTSCLLNTIPPSFGTCLGGSAGVTSIVAGAGLSGGTITSAGTLAVLYGTAANTAAQGNDSRITGALQAASNLADLNSASSARTALGLGTMATQAASSVAITGGTITGMPSPTLTSDVATKGYADSIAGGVNPRTAVKWATAAVLPNTPTYANGAAGVGATLTAGANAAIAVDSGSPSLNDRVLVKNQAATLQNGVYTVTTVGSGAAAWVLTRATDFDAAAEMTFGAGFLVTSGTANIGTGWSLAVTVTTVGTDPVTFNQYQSISGALLAASNLSDVAVPATARTNLGLAIGTDVQAFDSDLSALALNSTNGIWTRTGAGTGAARTITGTGAEITVTNGNGISGNPILSLPSALTFTGKIITNGTFTGTDLTAGANVKLNSNWLSNDGGNEGIKVDNSGNVGIGIAPVGVRLQANLAANKNIIFQDAGTSRIAFYNDALGATINGAVDASQLYLNANTAGFVGVNTASPNHALDVNGNIGILAAGYLNWGATDGTSGYGLRDNGGTIQIKNSGGSWTNIPTSGITQWTTAGSDIYYNTGGVLIGTTSAVTGSSVDVVGGSLYLAVTNPTMNQANCWGFFNNCETDGILSVVTYNGAVTSGSAIRGDVSRDTNGRVISGVSGTARAVNSLGEISGILGSTLYLGGGAGYAGWFFTYICGPGSIESQCAFGSGAAVDDTGLMAGQNRGEVAPAYGLLLSKEGYAETNNIGCCKAGILMTDFTQKGLWLWNIQAATWPIYSADGVGTQNFGIDSAGHVSFQGGTGAATTLCYNATDHAPMATITACSSDQRLKNEREKMPDGALDRIMQLIPRTFSFKTTPDKIEGGFFAQEVEKIMPHATYTNSDDMMGINTNAMLAEITKATQELAARNAVLESCMASWKCRLFGKGN